MALEPAVHEKTVLTKQVANNITIGHGAGSNFRQITDTSLAGKFFQGYKLSGVSNYSITIARVLIDSTGLDMVLVNNGTADATGISVDVYYR